MTVEKILRRLRNVVLVTCLGVVSFPAEAADEGSLQAFLKAHHCVVMETLLRIRAVEEAPRRPKSKNRYIILSLEADASNFAQCIFFENDTKAWCEAASGCYLTKPGEPRIVIHTPRTIQALAELGFDTTVAEGNFKLETDARTDQDIKSLVTLMLTALYQGFGVRDGMRLKIDAPLAKGHTSRCHPLS